MGRTVRVVAVAVAGVRRWRRLVDKARKVHVAGCEGERASLSTLVVVVVAVVVVVVDMV